MSDAAVTILNVDDNEPNRYAKTRSLRRAGFEVIEAETGTDAQRLVAERLPVLVLLDVKLPDINGIEVCRWIKREFPQTFVLQTSASFVTSDDRVRGLDGGADAYLTQPVEAIELIATVNALLRLHRAEHELQQLNNTLEQRVAERTAQLVQINALHQQEVTVRERAQRQQARAEARLHGYFETSPEFLALARPQADGLVLEDANPTVARLAGRPRAELAGRRLGTVLEQTQGGDIERQALECLRLDRPMEYEAEFAFFERPLRLNVMLAPLTLADGGGPLVLVCARDVTEQRRVEQVLAQSQKMEAVGQLTGGIAHDFNNLLTAIIGSLETLRSRLAQGRTDVTRQAEVALLAANRAAALTQRLLAFSRRQALAPRSLDVNALVTDMADLLRRSVGESVRIRTALAADLWRARSDPNQLESAVLNLAINARDAMAESGELVVETENVEFDAYDARELELRQGAYVMVAVRDTGEGMSEETRARAFEPFFTTKPIGQGTGLGLSQVYGFVKQSDGHMRIDSTPGKGTTVRLYLPRDTESAVAEEEVMPETQADHAGGGEVVLMVEDEMLVRELAVEALDGQGYRVLEAGDATQALAILDAEKRVDLLVTDVGLPVMNGRQLAEIARTRRPKLKILLVTGYAHGAAAKDDSLLANARILSKPFAMETLEATVRAILDED